MPHDRLPVSTSLRSWLRTAAWLGVLALAYLSLAPADLSPPRTRLPGEVEHFAAYACFAAFAALAFWRTVAAWLQAVAIIGYAAVLEYAQHWSPGRSSDLEDFVASAMGALTGIVATVAMLTMLARLWRHASRQRG